MSKRPKKAGRGKKKAPGHGARGAGVKMSTKAATGKGSKQQEHPETTNKACAKAELLKLNLGGGEIQIPGFINVDRHNSDEAYPLMFADNSAIEIRASHILEHFSHRDTVAVVKDWARVLAPGGHIKIAVPDFDKIKAGYEAGTDDSHEAYLMGAHSDPNDVHLAMFNAGKLAEIMDAAGLIGVRPWQDEIQDCAANPISLNLEGWKPGNENQATKIGPEVHAVLPMKVQAVISVPRLGFMDHMFCCYRSLVPLGIEIRRHMGAFWGMSMELGMNVALHADKPDAILCLDYDTIFDRQTVLEMVCLMHAHPEVDALAPVQPHQTGDRCLWTKKDSEFQNMAIVPGDAFADDLLQINTAHFGCTLIRTSALLDLPHPWFHTVPGPDGSWSEARVDGDIYFWRQFEKHQKKLFLSSRHCVGHASLMIRWPNESMEPTIYQPPADFDKNGKPPTAWKGTRR